MLFTCTAMGFWQVKTAWLLYGRLAREGSALVEMLQMALMFQVLAGDFQQITCKAIEKALSLQWTWEQGTQCFV